MKTLEQIAQENPLYYADMASKANATSKILSLNKQNELILIDTPKPDLSYSENRAIHYPSFEEQLDMLYWDKVNGTNIWQETIAKIKETYPKE